MPNTLTTYNVLAVLFCTQLPKPKSKEEDKKSSPAQQGNKDDMDSRLEKINEKINSLFTETNKRKANDKDDYNKGVSRDPFTTNQTPNTRTQEERREREAIIALTRNPSLPDYGRAYNAGLKEDFELKFGGIYTQEALQLALDAIKPVSEGGLGLKIKLGKDGFPDGTLSDGKPGKKFMLQPQDGSIFVQYTFGKSNIPFGGATYIRKFNPATKNVEWVLDEKITEPLPGTEALSHLCAYPLKDMGYYTITVSNQHKNTLGFTGVIEIVPEIDGSLFITEYETRSKIKPKRSGIYNNNNGTWALRDASPYRTTEVIKKYDLAPVQPMQTFSFYKLSGFDPAKYTKEIRDLIANANNLLPKQLPEPKGRVVEEEIPRILPGLYDAHFQGYKDKEGNYYIVTKHEVYRLRSTKKGTELEMYNFDDKKKGFTEATGSKLYQALYILRYGNYFPKKPLFT